MIRRDAAAFLLGLALAAFCAASAADPARSSSLEQAAKLNAELGIAYLQRGDIGVAQQKIDRALAENQNDPDVQTAAGLLYERIGEMDRAERHYLQAMRADAKDPNRQNNYAVFLCRRGSADKGHKLLEEVARNPRYATPEVALTNAGVCARSANKLDLAERDFKQALVLKATYPDALLQLADLCFTRGDLIDARAYLGRVMANVTPTADALLLGYKIERQAGDNAAAEDYAAHLRRDVPQADQVRQLDLAPAP